MPIQRKIRVPLHIRHNSGQNLKSLCHWHMERVRARVSERETIWNECSKSNERRCDTWHSHMIINIVACFHLPLKVLRTRKWYAPFAERTAVVYGACMKKLSRKYGLFTQRHTHADSNRLHVWRIRSRKWSFRVYHAHSIFCAEETLSACSSDRDRKWF